MKVQFHFLLLALFATELCHAEVSIEATCFLPRPQQETKSSVGFVLQSYWDTIAGQKVGAFVRYGISTKTIPLVFMEKIQKDQEDRELGNFEETWLEIVDGKVSGSYTVIQTGAGNKQGTYAVYKNKNLGRKTYFNKFGSTEDCNDWHRRLQSKPTSSAN